MNTIDPIPPGRPKFVKTKDGKTWLVLDDKTPGFVYAKDIGWLALEDVIISDTIESQIEKYIKMKNILLIPAILLSMLGACQYVNKSKPVMLNDSARANWGTMKSAVDSLKPEDVSGNLKVIDIRDAGFGYSDLNGNGFTVFNGPKDTTWTITGNATVAVKMLYEQMQEGYRLYADQAQESLMWERLYKAAIEVVIHSHYDFGSSAEKEKISKYRAKLQSLVIYYTKHPPGRTKRK